MQSSLQKYLEDMADALQAVATYLVGKTFDHYLNDRQLRSSVERELIIVGEAMSKIIHRFPDTKARLDYARRVANFRHILVHEYAAINDGLVWDVAQRSAPVLLVQVHAWLSELNRPPVPTTQEP